MACRPAFQEDNSGCRREVCRFYLQGRCNRNPCSFLHPVQVAGNRGSAGTRLTKKDDKRNEKASNLDDGRVRPNKKEKMDQDASAVAEGQVAIPIAHHDVDAGAFVQPFIAPVVQGQINRVTKKEDKKIEISSVCNLDDGSVRPNKKAKMDQDASAVAERQVATPIVHDDVDAGAFVQQVIAPVVQGQINRVTTKEDKKNEISSVCNLDDGSVRPNKKAKMDQDDGSAVTQKPSPQQNQKVRDNFSLIDSNCIFTESCRSSGEDEFFLVTTLESNRKPIKGIALPSGSKKLITSSIDEVKIWDCISAQCVGTINPGCRIGCLVGGDVWALLGIPGSVRVWNSETGLEQSLYFLSGQQVCALVVGKVNGKDFVYAGLSNGSILAWEWHAEGNNFQLVVGEATFPFAHRLAISILYVGREALYSGSADHTIKVWELATLQCLQTLTGHSDAVTSILCWDEFMLSGSLDGTVRVWARASMEFFRLETIYIHREATGVVTLAEMHDGKFRHVLMCSCGDFNVYFYELPSFAPRGRICSGDRVTHIVPGPEGFFFCGNTAGELQVWRWTGS